MPGHLTIGAQLNAAFAKGAGSIAKLTTEELQVAIVGGVLKGGIKYLDDLKRHKSTLVARIEAKIHLYPKVIDPRTGRNIRLPSNIARRVPKSQRVKWGLKERGEFISEWYSRGYKTPKGGWDKYDIHHIKPREFGGTNEFWNLVPVERGTHKEFNKFWLEFIQL